MSGTVTVVRGKSQTYHFPRTGKAKYSVNVDGSGTIRVQKGDSLMKYALAIHNSPAFAHVFGRPDNVKRRLVQIPFDTVINPGEIVVHLPTNNKNSRPGDPNYCAIKQPTKADQQRFIKYFLTKHLMMPPMVARLVDNANFYANWGRVLPMLLDLSTLFEANAGRQVLLSSMPAILEGVKLVLRTLGPILAPVCSIVGGFLAMYKSIKDRYKAIGFLAYSYGFTSIVYGDPPPSFSDKLAELTGYQATSFTRGNQALSEDAKNERKIWAENVHAGRMAALQAPSNKKINISKESFQLMMRLISKNDPKKLSAIVCQLMSSQLGAIQRLRMMQFVKNGCVYGK